MLAANKLIVLLNKNQGQSKLLQLKKKIKIAKVTKMHTPRKPHMTDSCYKKLQWWCGSDGSGGRWGESTAGGHKIFILLIV